MDQKYLDDIEALKTVHTGRVNRLAKRLEHLLSQREALKQARSAIRKNRAGYLSDALKSSLEEYNSRIRDLRLDLVKVESKVARLENRREEDVNKALTALKLLRLQEHELNLKRWIADPNRSKKAPQFHFSEEDERARLWSDFSLSLGISDALVDVKQAKKRFDVELAKLDAQIGQVRSACVERARELFPDDPDHHGLQAIEEQIQSVSKKLSWEKLSHQGKMNDLKRSAERRISEERKANAKAHRLQLLGIKTGPNRTPVDAALLQAEEELRRTEEQIMALNGPSKPHKSGPRHHQDKP